MEVEASQQTTAQLNYDEKIAHTHQHKYTYLLLEMIDPLVNRATTVTGKCYLKHIYTDKCNKAGAEINLVSSSCLITTVAEC